MSQRVEKLAVLFADICGSTALYGELGDDTARRMISQYIDGLSKEIAAHQGTLVKTIGDEVMCTFPSAEKAFNAACAMQCGIRDNRLVGGKRMFIRVGFHYGDVIHDSGDIFGDTVNVAARVTAITRAGQIMTTRTAVEALPQEMRDKTKHIMRAEFKGKQDYSDIFLVTWEPDDTMSTRIGMPAYRKTPDNVDELVLSYGSQSCRINKEHRRAMIGRGEICDIVVPGILASRMHAAVELRFGKFILADQSTNGTYIRFADGHVTHITREEVTLEGDGSFSLGESYSGEEAELIVFSTSSVPPRGNKA